MEAERFLDEYLRGVLASTLGVEADVRLMRERYPHQDALRLSERIVADSVTRSGQLGVVVGLATLVPIFGGAFLFGTIAADASLLLREQLAMLIRLSYLYDPDRPRAERELEAVGFFALHASDGDLPTSPAPALAGHFARQVFKHAGRRLMHYARHVISGWMYYPMSLIVSAKVNRDSTGELGEFVALELERRRRR